MPISLEEQITVTYPQLAKAWSKMVYGPHCPTLLALNPAHKSSLALLLSCGSWGLYSATRFEEIMRAPWILYKGSVMVFREDIPPNILRGWFTGNYRGDGIKRGLLEEVNLCQGEKQGGLFQASDKQVMEAIDR